MNGKWVRALIDSSCSFSHNMRQRFADGFVLYCSYPREPCYVPFYTSIFIYIFGQGLFLYLSLYLIVAVCMWTKFSLCSSARKQNMNAVSFRPFLLFLFFVPIRNQKSAGYAGKKAHTRVWFLHFSCESDVFFSLFIVAPASNCRQVSCFVVFLYISLCYVYPPPGCCNPAAVPNE